MPRLLYISHANVIVDANKPVPEWSLSDTGRQRHQAFGATDLCRSATRVISSDETKAIEAAQCMYPSGNPVIEIHQGLHENDRSSTGFLPPDEFEAIANEFFAHPDESVRGWETAAKAQERIVSNVMMIMSDAAPDDVVAFVGHGGVGTLLYCHFAGQAISRDYDQPPNGGGNVLAMDLEDSRPITAWTPLESWSGVPQVR